MRERSNKNINVFFEQRIIAFIIDVLIFRYLIIGILGLLFEYLIHLFEITPTPDDAGFMIRLIYVIFVIMYLLYCSLLESSKLKSSLGKYFFRFIVTDAEGNKISFSKSLIRNFSKLLSVLTLGIGFIMIQFTPKHQSLHDLIAKTQVVRR